jgi:3-methyladenine DNA glycosylase AlkD
MTFEETMGELERLGTEQNRKTYGRHGAPQPLFGVSFADIGKLTKRIKRDQALAEALWATGNTDARTLATTIADPAAFTPAKLDAWLGELRYYGLIDALVKDIAAPRGDARAMMDRWTASEDEWIGRAGWTLLGQIAADEASALPDAVFEERLATIEARIHGAKNRTRQAMNLALISIGGRNERLRKLAVAAAKRLGPIEVDHGDTSCKTFEAIPYIEKMWARKEKRPAAAKPAPAKGKSKKG